MKTRTHIVSVLFVSLICLLTACDREKMDFGDETNAYGQIRLSSIKLSVDVNATPLMRAAAGDGAAAASRAVSDDASDYVVGIYSKDGNTLISEWKYSAMPELFQLRVGEYQAVAHAPNTEGAAFDAPYCAGSVAFAITKDQVTNIETIRCTLQSIMVTVRYEDAFKNLLGEDAAVTVSVNKQNSESLTFEQNETRSGYFHGTATDNVVDVDFLGTIDGEADVPIHKSYSGIALGSQLVITYVLKDANGDPGSGGEANVSLRVDTRCDIVKLDGSVLPDKEPAIEDFPTGDETETPEPDKNLPTVSGDGFDIAKSLVVDESLDALNVKLAAPAGLAHVFISIESDSDDFQGAVNAMFALSENDAVFDLAHPKSGMQSSSLDMLHFPTGDAIIGQKVVDFDISAFLDALRGFEGTHKFNIRVEDVNGESFAATLTLVVPQQA